MINVYNDVGLIQEAEKLLGKCQRLLKICHRNPWHGQMCLVHVVSKGMLPQNMSWEIAISLIDMEPQNIAYYRLLLNVYAAACRWDDVAWVKEMMKENKVGRLPGCSLVDLNEIVHESLY